MLSWGRTRPYRFDGLVANMKGAVCSLEKESEGDSAADERHEKVLLGAVKNLLELYVKDDVLNELSWSSHSDACCWILDELDGTNIFSIVFRGPVDADSRPHGQGMATFEHQITEDMTVYIDCPNWVHGKPMGECTVFVNDYMLLHTFYHAAPAAA